MSKQPQDVYLVDAVRTPFGKAGSLYSETRADDLVVRAIRGLLDRNPHLPHERIDEVAIAALALLLAIVKEGRAKVMPA